MKRTLSAILVLCMLAAMLPIFGVASAATQATPFEVDFRTVDKSTLSGALLIATTKGENWSVNTDETTLRMGADIKLNVDYSPFADFQTWNKTGTLTLDFIVPADGTYNVDVRGFRRDAAGLGKFYIDGTYIGEEDFYAATNDIDNVKKKQLNSVTLTAGTHKLTIEAAGKTGGDYALLLIQRFVFVPAGYVVKPSEFVVDFTKVDKTMLGGGNGQYAVKNTLVKGPNWKLITDPTAGSTVFNASSIIRFYTDSYMQFGPYAGNINAGQDTLLIDFYVPMEGTYDVSGLFVRNTVGGYGEIYIDGSEITKYDFYNTAVETKADKISKEPITLTEGRHQFKIKASFSQVTTHAYVPIYNFTFTPIVVEDNSVPATITFAADSIGDVALSIDGVPQSYKKLSSVQVERGQKIAVKALAVDGKKFVGWVRGSADYGRIVSVDAEYEFTAATHTMLTAVYTDIPEDTAAVEYYNENGQYLETKAAADGKPANNPTLVGYVFNDWWVAQDTPLVLESVTKLTRAVAKFAKQGTKYSVTVPENTLGAASGEYAYDDELTLTSASGEVYWLRDGKVVDYGTSYTFNVWGNTVITTATSGYDNAPKIVLDGVVKDDAYMIEYDSGDKTVIEVGIIFGSSDAITVASCSEKMNSQRNSSHGQFTAQSDYEYAKGYLIYKDGGEYKVIYSE